MRKLVTAVVTAAAVAVISLAGAAPALACGDTPGFCPNPPDSNSSDSGYVVGTDGDF